MDKPLFYSKYFFVVFLSGFFLLACGGGGGGSDEDDGETAPPLPSSLTISFTQVKTFNFSWSDADDATHYRLMENPDGSSGFSQVGGDIGTGLESYDHVVPLHERLNAQYMLQTCFDSTCKDSDAVAVTGTLTDSIGYFKASNTDLGDNFGSSVSISGDGKTLAVGAVGESSNATGVNGDQNNNSTATSGAVYIFTLDGNTWSQQAYLKASNTDTLDVFGVQVSLSNDGNTLAVGAQEDNAVNGINGDQNDNSDTDSGAVYVFTRSGTNWSQQAYIKASNSRGDDLFGNSLNLSGDGNTLAVGARGEASDTSGVNAVQGPYNSSSSGAVYVFIRNGGTTWSEQAYIKSSNSGIDDLFGISVSLNDDGNTLAVGASREDSDATGIGGDQNNDLLGNSGAVYVYTRSGTTWTQQSYIKASNTGTGDDFGHSVSLSDDGNSLAVGAPQEKSSATGIDGNQSDDTASSGAVYTFLRTGSNWNQTAYIKASNTGSGDQFGYSLSLSGDGETLVVAASQEESNATGLNGDQSDNSAIQSGAVYTFGLNGNSWDQVAYIKSNNTQAFDDFSSSVSISNDGSTVAVGALMEDSNATGISGDDFSNGSPDSGAVYLY